MAGVEADVVKARQTFGDNCLDAEGVILVKMHVIHKHFPVQRHGGKCCAETKSGLCPDVELLVSD